jgi:hypothetical protein
MKTLKFTESQNKVFVDLALAMNRFGILLGIFAVMLLFLGLSFAFAPNHAAENEARLMTAGIGVAAVAVLTLIVCFLLLKPADQYRQVLKKHPRVTLPIVDGLQLFVKAEKYLRFILVLFLLAGVLGVVSARLG